MADTKAAKPWQLRLAPEEDEATAAYAKKQMASKNDVVRRALKLFFRVDAVAADGGRLLLERAGRNGEPETIEVWLL